VNKKAESTATQIKSNPARWQRLKNILADALEQTSFEERTAVLRRSCGDDTTLLREAEELLAHDTTAFEEFADFAATRLKNGERDRVGERLGAYELVKELGRGGMGAVYLAERADGQFEKRVAIKVLKRGTDTDEVLRRFRIERQILANLEHPNITRLLDAGITSDGLPYFVMEFIEGKPITQFVQRENVDLRGRLKLFLKVCSAVDLAHRHHIIHRDIKPGNVLVNHEGEPKLLDFGIAKLLEVDSDDEVTTIVAERRLTPMYAAPEQRAGQPATKATDVYSLGALLYELLTERSPCSSSNGNLSQEEGSKGSTEPQLPSQVVTDPKTRIQLQGQLDQIVARVVRRDPAERYSSVIDLSEDIESYLSGVVPRSLDRIAPSRDAKHNRVPANLRWSIAAVGLAAIALTAGLFFSFRTNVSKPKMASTATTATSPARASSATVPSIAVLPFENLSEEKENAYFADGIQADILTSLSKIGDLKVISRRSVMAYRGKVSNIREIGRETGASAILEGSVRRAGNRVRVNVQLINAENGEQTWAEDYDRDLVDIFAIQTDLAQKIASELDAKLSPAEKARIERKPTESSEAYLALVQAQNLDSAFEDFGKLKQSELLYERAIELDPKFALALARYSKLESWIAYNFDRTLARKEKARTLAERALELKPNLPEAHLATGYSYYYGDKNYDAALREFEIAQRGLPNDAEVYLALGAIQRRHGKWKESTFHLEKAVSLNPKDTWPLQNLTFNYQILRDFGAATKTIDRALKLDPNGSGLWEIKATLAISEKGDLSVAEKALAAMNALPANSREQKIEIAGVRANLLLLLRNYRELLQEADNLPDDPLGSMPAALGSRYYRIGIARKALHDEAGARAAFLKAKSITETQLKKSPDHVDARVQLAAVLAWLGEKDAALAEAQHAMGLLPESKDAFIGPKIREALAAVHAILGENVRAIEILEGLLSRPSFVTAQYLKVSPVWDSLRNDPRFQALLNQYGSEG
jgi:eukaryotic-like serine/threonine-protein kinase